MQTKNIRTFYIVVFFPSHTKPTEWISGTIKIEKKIENNQIISIVPGKTLEETNLTYAKGRARIENIERYNKIDFIITSDDTINADCYVRLRNLYALQNQDKIIRNYLNFQDKIRKGKTKLLPQLLTIGNGLDIDDGASQMRYRLQYATLSTYTLILMLAIDEVLNHKIDALLLAMGSAPKNLK